MPINPIPLMVLCVYMSESSNTAGGEHGDNYNTNCVEEMPCELWY